MSARSYWDSSAALSATCIDSADIFFVAAHEEHRFHGITQDLVLLVVFAPSMT